MVQDLLPLLLQNHQLFVLLSPQTLQVVQVNTLHLSQLTLRLLQVAFRILQQQQTGGDAPELISINLQRTSGHLDDTVQDVPVPLKHLTQHHDVMMELCDSSLAKNRPPAVVELQQVDCGVALLLLQLVLISEKHKQLLTDMKISGQ